MNVMKQTNIMIYYTSVSFFLYKNMTVVLLLHPKILGLHVFPFVVISAILFPGLLSE
jgi:hypothetical protein